MTNKEKFLKLVSKDKTDTIERAKERVFKRKQQNIRREFYSDTDLGDINI